MANKRKSKVVKQVKVEKYELEGGDDEVESLNELEEYLAEVEAQRHHFTVADAVTLNADEMKHLRSGKVRPKSSSRKVMRAKHHPHAKKMPYMAGELQVHTSSIYDSFDAIDMGEEAEEQEVTAEQLLLGGSLGYELA